MSDLEKTDTIASSDHTLTRPLSREFAPITTSPSKPKRSDSRRSKKQSSLRSLSRTRSNNGYGCDDGYEEEGAVESANGAAAGTIPEKDPWEVRWENGDEDPGNPRSMSYGKKWFIVIIVSASSCCV